MLNAPCFHCAKRFTGCHATCDDYKLFQLQVEAARKRRIEDRAPDMSPANRARHNRFLRKFYSGWKKC